MAKRFKWLVDYSFSLCDASHGACWCILFISISFCLFTLFPCDFTGRVNCDRNIRIECHILFSIGIGMIIANFKVIKRASVWTDGPIAMHWAFLQHAMGFSLLLGSERSNERAWGVSNVSWCYSAWIIWNVTYNLRCWPLQLALVGSDQHNFVVAWLRCKRFYRFWVWERCL